jgi:small subunit ribosomal protein S15Ae
MGRRILNDALRKMVNADRRGNATALLQPISGVMVSFLNIMKHRGMESVPLLTCCLTSCFL